MTIITLQPLNEIFVTDVTFENEMELGDYVTTELTKNAIKHICGHAERTSENEFIFHIENITCRIKIKYLLRTFIATIIFDGALLKQGIEYAIRTKLGGIFKKQKITTIDAQGGFFRMIATTNFISFGLEDLPSNEKSLYDMSTYVTFADRNMQEVMSGCYQ